MTMTEIDEDTPVTGGCLCGAVRVVVTAPPVAAGNCHCLDCRKFFGAGHATVSVFPESAVAVKGAVSAYTQRGGSGEDFTRYFCPTCGGPVYGETKAAPAYRLVPLAILDDAEARGMAPRFSMFTRSAVAWDPPAADIPAFENGPPTRR